MGRLPFQDTQVEVSKTVLKVKEMLHDVGFTTIAELSQGNKNTILVAEIASGQQKASFKFEAHLELVVKQLPYSWDTDRRHEQAARIAWRVIFFQIKGLCDSIKIGITTIPEAFGGNLLLIDDTGNSQKLSEFVANGLQTGRLSSSMLSQTFQLEAPK